MFCKWVVAVWVFGPLLLLTCVEGVKFNWPEKWSENEDGFWFGTQSLYCMNSKISPRNRRSIIISQDNPSISGSGFPSRSTIRYIHRLVFYRGTTFEWGGGVRGYHIDPNPSTFRCPVTWERDPAGVSRCPVSEVVNFTLGYRNRFGSYDLLLNNCHHFANRVSKLLSDGNNCGLLQPPVNATPLPGEADDDGVVTWVEKMLASIVNYFL